MAEMPKCMSFYPIRFRCYTIPIEHQPKIHKYYSHNLHYSHYIWLYMLTHARHPFGCRVCILRRSSWHPSPLFSFFFLLFFVREVVNAIYTTVFHGAQLFAKKKEWKRNRWDEKKTKTLFISNIKVKRIHIHIVCATFPFWYKKN